MSPIYQLVHVSTFRSIKLRPICSLRARLPFFHLNALTHVFSSIMNVTSCFFVSSSLFPVERGHLPVLPLAISFMTKCFVLLTVLLPLSFSSRFFPLLLLSSLLSFSFFLRHSGTSPSMVGCLNHPPPFPLRSSIFCFVIIAVSTVSHACWKITVNFHDLVPASSLVSL